ncbi:hypothetical protein ACFX12_023283 [Malus domestica]
MSNRYEKKGFTLESGDDSDVKDDTEDEFYEKAPDVWSELAWRLTAEAVAAPSSSTAESVSSLYPSRGSELQVDARTI